MHLTLSSKKLIVTIAAVTFVAVVMAGMFTTETQTPEPQTVIPLTMKNTASPSAAVNVTQNKPFSQAEPNTDRVQEPAQAPKTPEEKQAVLIKSLTNTTQNVVFTPSNTLKYTGYIQGAGYASYVFYAQRGQVFTAQLLPDENKIFEMILFASQVQVLSSGQSFTIPNNGFYELRILFRNSIEAIQVKAAKQNAANPIAYNLSLEMH